MHGCVCLPCFMVTVQAHGHLKLAKQLKAIRFQGGEDFSDPVPLLRVWALKISFVDGVKWLTADPEVVHPHGLNPTGNSTLHVYLRSHAIVPPSRVLHGRVAYVQQHFLMCLTNKGGHNEHSVNQISTLE